MLMAYDDNGPGPVVVLLHGFPLDRSMWAAQSTEVGSTYRVIAPDLRGHGDTPAADGASTMDIMADDVIESAVYGREDDEFGQVVVATAVVRAGAPVTAEQLREHCGAALAYYKVPIEIDVRTAELPRNAAGKVLKQQLRDELGGEAGPGPQP